MESDRPLGPSLVRAPRRYAPRWHRSSPGCLYRPALGTDGLLMACIGCSSTGARLPCSARVSAEAQPRSTDVRSFDQRINSSSSLPLPASSSTALSFCTVTMYFNPRAEQLFHRTERKRRGLNILHVCFAFNENAVPRLVDTPPVRKRPQQPAIVAALIANSGEYCVG